MITCAPAQFSWNYTGPEGQLLLDITDDAVLQSSNPPPTTKCPRDNPITFIVTYDADPLAFNFTWPAVKVSQGSYIVEGLIYSNGVPILSAQSAVFEVLNGTDTSCVVSIPSSSSSPSSPTQSPSLASPSSSTMGGPVLSSSSKESNKGTIAGAIVGAIALISILSICLIILRRNRYRHSSATRTWRPRLVRFACLNYRKFTTGSQFKKHSKSKKAPVSTRLEQRISDPFSNKHAAPGGVGVVERTSDDDATAFSYSEEKIVGAENGRAAMVIGAGNDAISPLPYTYPTRRSSLNSASVRRTRGKQRELYRRERRIR
jgi:hypothetical protein